MKKESGLLKLETKKHRVLFEGKPLEKVTKHWAFVFGLLIARELEAKETRGLEADNKIGQVKISVKEIAMLSGWTGQVNEKSIGGQVSKYIKAMNPKILTFAPREGTKSYFLNPDLVLQVDADIKGNALQAWLSGTKAVQAPPFTDMTIVMFESAQKYFEAGIFEKASELTEKILLLEISFDQHIRTLALQAWIKLYQASRKEAEVAVKLMLAKVKEFRNSGNKDQLSNHAQVIALVQAARLHNYYQDDPKLVEKYYVKADKLLQPDFHYERGAIFTGRGLAAQRQGLLEESYNHHCAAVKAWSEARWTWGLSAALNNLACIILIRFEAMPSQKSVEAKNSLVEAKEYLKQALSLVDSSDIGCDINEEVNMVFICRHLEDFDSAREYLKQARRVFIVSKPVRQQGLYYAEKAELELADGNLQEAIGDYKLSAQFFENLGETVWLEQVRQRLFALETGKLSKPLKLW